jgi:integrase
MNATKAELSRLQERIAEGRAPELPEGKDSEFYWHPHIAGFGLRLYANGAGSWLVQYRNGRKQRRHTLGDATVLTLSLATIRAKKTLGDVANGIDPEELRQEELAKESYTFRAMAERMFHARRIDGPKPLSPKTLYLYRSMLKNHVGKLATMQMDEIKKRNVAEVLTDAAAISQNLYQQTRAFISVVFKWGNQEGLIDIPNPVDGTAKPDKLAKRDNPLSLEELGGVWRACEAMAAEQPSYRGNPWGAQAPKAANSIRDGATLMTLPEATRQSGISTAILYKAIEAKQLKVIRRGVLPPNHPANHPSKITQGKGHKRDVLVEASEIDRLAAARSGLMRSAPTEFSAIIRLLILLGGRLDEMGALHWDEIIERKEKRGVVQYLHIKGKRTPKRRGTKNGLDLNLPLPQMALDILAKFPKRTGNPRVFGDKGAKGIGYDRMKKRLDAMIAENEGQPIKPWHIHDLRHTLSTRMNELGLAPPWIIEDIVNHSRKGMFGHYNHAKYDVPVDVALKRWAQVVRNAADRVESEDNVLSFFEHRKEA